MAIKMPEKTIPRDKLPYDDTDPESIIGYAAKLTGKSLREVMGAEQGTIGGTAAKGKFGQMVEDYFFIKTNSDAVPDFEDAGIELKVSPLIDLGRGKRKSKERLVLGIIDYNKVPEEGFGTFLRKNSHLLIVFYLWSEHTDITEYRILKVVDWTPTEEELRVIREDWDVIQGFVERGEAHLLSERFTRYLAANTKGVGHGKDLRSQPFSDIPAKQRSLSFKQSFMTVLYETHPDVRARASGKGSGLETVFHGEWDPDTSFSGYILGKMDRFRGMTCEEIELELGVAPNAESKQYYSKIAMAMLGVTGKGRIKEFEEANIRMKTIRLTLNGAPKESMSFPKFVQEEVVAQSWEESDFFSELDHEFLFPVFGFRTKHPKEEDRRGLVFLGAFMWCIPEEDLEVVKGVWLDTKDKLAQKRTDFVKISDKKISHVRPHDTKKRFDEEGNEVTDRCFWLNGQYIKGIVRKGLSDRYPDHDR